MGSSGANNTATGIQVDDGGAAFFIIAVDATDGDAMLYWADSGDTNTIIAAAEILPVAIIDSVTIADGDFTVDNFTIVA